MTLQFEAKASNENLVVISKSCFWIFDSYWGEVKPRKLIINNWVHVSLGFVSGNGGRLVGRWNDIYLFGRIFVWRFNRKNVKCGEMPLEPWGKRLVKNPWDSVWQYDRNSEMHLGEYLIDAWLDFVTKLQKYTSFAYSWSTSEECKNIRRCCTRPIACSQRRRFCLSDGRI